MAANNMQFIPGVNAEKPQRVRANGLVNMRVRRGMLNRPDACTQCGRKGKVDAHHEDYAAKEAVEWLCRSCHMKRHWKHKMARSPETR